MPVVEYQLKDLLELMGAGYSERELSVAIPMMGTDLAGIKDGVITVEVFPNRPDILNIEGFARALKGFMGVEGGLARYGVSPSGMELLVEKKNVEGIRPFISAAIVKDLELSEDGVVSLMNVQEKLHITHGRNRRKVAIGVHDLDKIKGPFTYTAKNPKDVSFIPLDMNEKMNLQQILSRHPKGRDYAWTVEGFKKYPVIFDSTGEVLSFPPIINGEYSRVGDNTRNIFIECTGTSQNACDIAVNIIVTGLADRGGKIQSIEVSEK
ncbi:MAG TPA: phenylalanine--tRNA ligase subunit beta [Candidatus Altiarchaeales archaeon]|nr:phenylalanine--tRNA ligase subunit beta [Candidatus Altiarchaeales archaeon]